MTNNACNTYIVPTTNNEVTMPSQPAFLAYLSATDNNVSGNGGLYTLGTTGNVMTEVFDQNADYNVNGTFTAPVTAQYFLSTIFEFRGIVASTNGNIVLHTSNRDYIVSVNCLSVAATGSGAFVNIAILADMDAADIATVTFQATGEVGDIMDVIAIATYMSGFLAV